LAAAAIVELVDEPPADDVAVVAPAHVATKNAPI